MSDLTKSKNSEFYKITKNRPPSLLLIKALEFAKQKNTALDLGCGAGRDTRYLVEQGFRVTAIDVSPQTESLIRELPNQENIMYETTSFEDFQPAKYDLVNAQWSLPFTNKESFDEVWLKVIDSINQGGIFVGQLFGVNDEWNTADSKMTFHTRIQVETLLKGLDIMELKEEDIDSTIANGTPKHWHVFHIIAKKSLSKT
jgi:tellurite methyltransferase